MNIEDAIKRYAFADVEDEYLSHHGIKGQKWGIRRFQNPDGTLTAEGKARYVTDDGHLTDAGLKKYAKDTKKLTKLKARANTDVQQQNLEKYNKRAEIAKKVGLGSAAVAGAMAGVTPLKNFAGDRHDANIAEFNRRKNNFNAINRYDYTSLRINNLQGAKKRLSAAAKTIDRENGVLYNVWDAMNTIERGKKVVGVAAAATAAGAGAAYAYNKYQSHLANKRLTEIGHQQAVEDVKKHMDYMKKAYGDVKLDDLYKKNSK